MGVFNPSGNPLAPTIKICGNPQTLENWGDGIDVNLSGVLAGAMNLDDAGRVVAKAVLQVVEGERTKTEMWGEGQFIVPRMLAAF